MNGVALDAFFLQPTEATHRRYEALRALFVERQSRQQVSARFGVSTGTLSNRASEFRSQMEADEPPPFFKQGLAEDPLNPFLSRP